MKKIILAILGFSLLIELILSFVCIFSPTSALEIFKIDATPQTIFLGYIIGWLCLFVSSIIVLAIYYLKNNEKTAFNLIYCLGLFWVLLGFGVYFSFNKFDNLILDTSKGLLLILFTYRYQQKLKNEN
jgi:sulfite exporter TauE/SafE